MLWSDELDVIKSIGPLLNTVRVVIACKPEIVDYLKPLSFVPQGDLLVNKRYGI